MKYLLATLVLLAVFQSVPAAAQESDPFQPVIHNADWAPVEQDFDGVTMVLVPAGCFMMGSEDGSAEEKPVNQQCFSEPFWIDKTEVTQGEFARLGGVQAAMSGFSGDNRPVERITWFEARDFCDLRGGWLPTEVEWEYAARGPDGLVYPWGNGWKPDSLVWSENSSSQTAEVSSKSQGISWVRAYDLAGNVWEWVNSWYAPYPYERTDGREIYSGSATHIYRVFRGGSWLSVGSGSLRATFRSWNYPDGRSNYTGFRCVRSFDTSSTVLGFNPVTRNADWTPVTQEFDDVEMVLVPAGCFLMGSEDGDDDEKPVNPQCFEQPFWIDKYEVMQADFARLGSVQAIASYFSGDNHPVEQITWFEARDSCELRGGRLPTEAEWEYAARGPDGLVYPWGNDWNPDNVVGDRGSNQSTANVGSLDGGESWVGAYDMSGNVWEWVSSIYESYPYVPEDGREDPAARYSRRVLRSGSWDSNDIEDFRAAFRGRAAPSIGDNRVGFRCARTYQ